MIEFTDVTKVFGPRPREAVPLVDRGLDKATIRERTGHTVALSRVTLSIEPHGVFVVMGLSGCGKSTLLRLVNRLIEPTVGRVRVDGVDITALSEGALLAFRRRRIGMVFQRFGLFPHRTVLQNVAYGLEIQGIDRAQRERTARGWIDAVGLEGYETAHPEELSGGMQQRVGLARALATDPDVLLMDEPFGALDPLIRREMQDQLLALQGRLGKTVVFVTHDLSEALRLGDRIAILKDGVVEQIGTPQDVLHEPGTEHVAAFVASVADLGGRS
jgi:glycine betaine/proline transport system ATP-binding protein